LAGLGRKEFNSGDILLASEVQGYLQDQAVMVFDDATARGSAIPSPSEGMLTYNKDTDQLELYDGSAFGPVGSDAGLIHIETDSFSAVSAVDIDGVFSADYTNYKVVIKLFPSTAAQMLIRYRFGGATRTGATAYISQRIQGDGTSVTGLRSTAASSAAMEITTSSAFREMDLTIFSPFADLATYLTGTNAFNTSPIINLMAISHGESGNQSQDGFQLAASSGTITGSYSVYGLKES
jgi:hypothetical protein